MRGSQQPALMLPPTYLTGVAGSELVNDLREALESTGVQLVDTHVQAGLVVQISDERKDQRVLSFNNAGKVGEYELNYSLHLQAVNSNGDIVLSEDLSRQRDYVFDEQSILAKSEEASMLVREMRADLVRGIIRRLQSIK